MSLSGAARRHCFAVPALDGPITGGTLYNRELIAALRTLSDVRLLDLSTGRRDEAEGLPLIWVDSLYLRELPLLRDVSTGKLGLIVHYLPSFVRLGRRTSRAELSPEERAALAAADAFLVTSEFMRGALEALVAPNQKPILVVEPGTHAALAPAPPLASAELRVITVGNLVEGKGIEPWLGALNAALGEDDRLKVWIIGSLSALPEYAERCQALVRRSPELATRVTFLGALSEPETLAWLARGDLFVSASRMESYGIALSEARVVGLPILACAGGNAAAHVDPEAGGELVSDPTALARACLALARDSALCGERQAKARARAPLGRSWLAAAREFTAQLALWEK
jgi:glycosyltransferase involved in cell wall biosynthesis